MYILKFVLRSWWRNKLFVTISLVSLVIGIACTNLLTAFVLYEYNIEYNNPNRDRDPSADTNTTFRTTRNAGNIRIPRICPRNHLTIP